jgi:RP/EB family microtubule-associated protein
MSKNTAIGIMDEAYFVPKKEILSWMSNALRLDIIAIEDLGTGAVYCQLLDYAFGQRVPMHKVSWKAKFEYEFIHNLKVFL